MSLKETIRGTGSARHALAVWNTTLVILAAATVLVGPNVVSAGSNELRVVCADWFYTNRNQVHVVLHVEDAAGNGVAGAKVSVENSVDAHDGRGPVVYTRRTSTTSEGYNFSGMNHESSCVNSSTTTTGALCCTLGRQKGCPEGYFTTRVISVTPPEGSGLVWDGVTPPNGREMFIGGNVA